MFLSDVLTAVLTGVGLAMDAFAVSVANGISCRFVRFSGALKVGLFFGFFQFLMPMLGYYISSIFSDEISDYDHIIAPLILIFLGIKMIAESLKDTGTRKTSLYLSARSLLPQAVATSIDALAVGITYSVLKFTSLTAFFYCSAIGIVTFFISSFGVMLGKKLGNILKNKAGIIGGIILIILAIKIFVSAR